MRWRAPVGMGAVLFVAVGSLYQFFPSKEALAETLANRCVTRMAQELEDIAAHAASQQPARLADLLVDLMLKMRADRDVAIELFDSGAVPAESRKLQRHLICTHVAAILRASTPALSDQQVIASAALLAHIIKLVPVLAVAEEQSGKEIIAEARRILMLYIEGIRRL